MENVKILINPYEGINSLFHIDKEGKEHCVAVYDSKNDRFIPTDYWKENFEERK